MRINRYATKRNMKKPFSKKTTVIIGSVLAIAIVCLIVFDAFSSNREFQKSTTLMNTVVSVSVEGKKSDEAGQRVLAAIGDLETRSFSRHIASTSVSRLNENAGQFLQCDDLMLSLAKKCIDVNEKSNGAFNPLLGKLSDMWGFGTGQEKVPDAKELQRAVEAVKGKKIVIDGKNIKIPENTVFDLGAVGKGAACDQAKSILKTTKTKRAVISVGGSLLLYGENESFNVGVRNPLGQATEVVGKLVLSDTCVSTSGSYERYFTENGKTYHHIINPENGYPTDNDLLSVTVVCSDGFMSDALSTACFVLGYEDSQALLEQYDAEAMFIFKDKTIKLTQSLKDSFELTDKSFKLV